MTSPLDLWSQAQFNKDAIRLSDVEYGELVSYIQKTADADVHYWEPRNARMLESQRFWEIGGRKRLRSGNKVVNAFSPDLRDVDKIQESEDVEFNDGYITVDKIVSLITSANWGMNVPAKNTTLDSVAQRIEDLLRWCDEELNVRYSSALNGDLGRDEGHFAALRGWICGLITPNPDDPRVPWSYLLEDPLLVYPRYSRDKLIRVCHRFSMTALEATVEYPQAWEFLSGRNDDDEVEVTTYYDERYVMTLIGGIYYGPTNNPDIGSSKSSAILRPLVAHGYTDIYGIPQNPWIIYTPRGTPTRRIEATRGSLDRDVVALIGLDVLHPIKDIIVLLERLASQLHTEVAKSSNPPVVWYVQPGQEPRKLDLGAGGTNFAIFGDEKVELLSTSAAKADFSPLWEMYTDRLQRGSLPTVLYGESIGALAGYAISILTDAAKGILDPLLRGLKMYRQMKYRRLLEMYVNIGSKFSGELSIRSQDRVSNKVYTEVEAVSAEDIRENGVFVEVTYDDPLPQDKLNILTAVIGGKQAGILPLHDIYTDWLHVPNPRATRQRLEDDWLYEDPLVRRELALIRAEKSGDEDLREAVRRVKEQENLRVQQGSPQDPTANVPPEVVPPSLQPGEIPSPPSNINPIEAILRQLENVSAGVNVRSGASPPNLPPENPYGY